MASFGDTAAEFRALLEGCGLFDMSWQAKLVLTGEDRVRWLNGMVTNNVRDLAVGHGVYNFVLTAQGRIVGDLVAYNRGDFLLVTTDRAQAAAITEIFDRYIIMDDVEVADISDKLSAVGIAGPRAAETLRKAGIGIPQLPRKAILGHPRNSSRDRSSIWCGATWASRLRAARIPTWMPTRSGSPPSRPTRCGMRWSLPARRRWAAKRWSCTALRAAFRAMAST